MKQITRNINGQIFINNKPIDFCLFFGWLIRYNRINNTKYTPRSIPDKIIFEYEKDVKK